MAPNSRSHCGISNTDRGFMISVILTAPGEDHDTGCAADARLHRGGCTYANHSARVLAAGTAWQAAWNSTICTTGYNSRVPRSKLPGRHSWLVMSLLHATEQHRALRG